MMFIRVQYKYGAKGICVCVIALVRPSPVCPDVLSEWVGANVCVINRFNGDTF